VRELLAFAGKRMTAVEVDGITGALAGARRAKRENPEKTTANAAGRAGSTGLTW